MSLGLQVAKNTAYLTAGKIISTLLGAGSVALLLRYLPPDDYGRYATALAFILLFGTVTDLGLNLTTTQDIALPENDVSKTLSTAFTLRLLINLGLIAVLPLLLAFFPYEPAVKEAIYIAALLFFSATLFQVLASYFQTTLNAGRVVMAELAGKTFLLLAFLFAVYSRYSLRGLMVLTALAALVQLIILVVFLRREVALRFAIDYLSAKRIFGKTWPVAISVVLTTIYFKGDTIIMSLYRPYAEVGIYGAAYKVLEVLITVPILFMGLLLAPLTRAFAGREAGEFNKLMQRAWDMLSLLTLPLAAGIFTLAGPILTLVAGPDYAPGAPVLRILILATGIIFLGSLFTHAIVAINEQKRMIAAYALTAALALALYLIYIPRYGYFAAAIITVLAELVIALAAAGRVYRRSKIKLSFMVFGKALAAAVGMAVALAWAPRWPLAILIGLGIMVYFSLLSLFQALPPEVRPYLNRLRRRA